MSQPKVSPSQISFPLPISYTTNATLSALDVGRWVEPNANGITLTLPPVASVEIGGTFTFISRVGAYWSLKANAAELIRTGSGDVNQIFYIQPGEYLKIANHAGAWYAIYSAYGPGVFNSFNAQNGYQMLPSRVILQWGWYTLTVNPETFSYPITFPNGVFNIFVSQDHGITSAGQPVIGASLVNNSQFIARNDTGIPNPSDGFSMFAIGY